MKILARLPTLAVVTVAGLALATALSPALASRVTATASSQAPLWVTHQFVKRGGATLAVAASPDGSAVFVAGEVNRPHRPGSQATVTALNPATGATLWQSPYTASPNSGFSEIAVSPDGSEGSSGAAAVTASGAAVFATGGTTAAGQPRAHVGTVAYDAGTGTRLWARIVNVPCLPTGIAAGPDGSSVYVLNSTFPSAGGVAYATEAYAAATGDLRWTAHYQGPVAGSFTLPEDLAVSPDSAKVYVTGNTTPYATTIGYGS